MPRSLSKLPAPKAERITGSKINKPGSASSKMSGVIFSKTFSAKIKAYVVKYNKANPDNKMALSTAKAVVRRGMGAYSRSHRPTIRGGKPNSRQAWGLARLFAFMRLKSGSNTANGAVRYYRIKKTYTQDNDLL